MASLTHSAAATAADAAAALGVVDALVFRRIAAASWAHVGGLGRGQGWAGIINIEEADDALAIRVPEQVGAVDRAESAEPDRVLGPYYASSSAVVRVSPDVAVVLGSPDGSLARVDDVSLLRLATRVDAEINDVGPSKRLADELEVLTAVREVMDAPIDYGLIDTLRYITTVAARALGCEIGVLRPRSGELIVIGDAVSGGSSPHSSLPSSEEWATVLDEVESRLSDQLWCAQDMASSPSLLLARVLPQARAVLATRVPDPVGGSAIFIHTARDPRGFSRLCQRLLDNILETGLILARTAMLRDALRFAADQAVAAARTDPLTGLGNRLAWDEATGKAQEAVDAGATYSVVSLDVDGLKDINDEYGHPAGDELLRRCAEIIRQHCSSADLAVRMGGDEFSVLVPHALAPSDRTYVAFHRAFSELRSTTDSVAASLGVCTVSPGDSLFDAIRQADMRMYANKKQRRLDRAAAHVQRPIAHTSLAI
ncbi:MAG: GGDEF domain-containing protein [Nakamurella sp.]